MLLDKVGEISKDIAVQGGRAAGTASAESDWDIMVRISPEEFNKLIAENFAGVNLGSAAERTMQHAIEVGKLDSGEAALCAVKKDIIKLTGMDVDISIIK